MFLSFSLSLKRCLRALPRALSCACASLDMVSLEFVRCNFFVGKLTKVCSCMMGCSKLTRAFGHRKRSRPVRIFERFIFLRNRNKKYSFINLAVKLTQPLFNPNSSLSKHSHDIEYSSITIAFEKVQCIIITVTPNRYITYHYL